MKIACVYREQRFSPGMSTQDRLIMDIVADRVGGCASGDRYSADDPLTPQMLTGYDLILSMARSERVIAILSEMEKAGAMVINPPRGIRLCRYRQLLTDVMTAEGISVPDSVGYPCWVKRADDYSEVSDDVCYCRDEAERDAALRNLSMRGISTYTTERHIVGDLLKFYGVGGTDMIHTVYPTDTGHTKFGLERYNGEARHYAFDIAELKRQTDRVALRTGVVLYGGDAIVTPEGRTYIIDFNDWPTFSGCQHEAADAFAGYIMKNRN